MSATEIVIRYLRERARVRLFAPLALFLATAGSLLVAGGAFRVDAFLWATFGAFVFCLAFRVWDDLEDRSADRVRHSERVMSLVTTTRPFVALIGVLAVGGAALLVQFGGILQRAAALGLAVAILSVWYAGRPSEKWNRLAGEHIVSLKYPLIAYAVAPALPGDSLSWRVVGVLAAVYATVCIYGYVDDPELRHIFASRRSVS